MHKGHEEHVMVFCLRVDICCLCLCFSLGEPLPCPSPCQHTHTHTQPLIEPIYCCQWPGFTCHDHITHGHRNWFRIGHMFQAGPNRIIVIYIFDEYLMREKFSFLWIKIHNTIHKNLDLRLLAAILPTMWRVCLSVMPTEGLPLWSSD